MFSDLSKMNSEIDSAKVKFGFEMNSTLLNHLVGEVEGNGYLRSAI